MPTGFPSASRDGFCGTSAAAGPAPPAPETAEPQAAAASASAPASPRTVTAVHAAPGVRGNVRASRDTLIAGPPPPRRNPQAEFGGSSSARAGRGLADALGEGAQRGLRLLR